MQILINKTFADSSFNCRGLIMPYDVQDLMLSIKSKGLLQSITVQPYKDHFNKYDYRVVMGHRRFEACKLLGWEYIEAIVRNDLDENQARTINFVENLERKDLTIMQEARTIDKYIKSGYDRDEISKMINKSSGWIQNRIAAMKLPADIQDKIDDYKVTQEQIRIMAGLISSDDQYAFMRDIMQSKIRGEKQIKTPKLKKKASPYERRERTISEMFEMQDNIRESIGNGILTRILGWCAGEVSTIEFMQDFGEYCDEQGFDCKVRAS